MLKAHKKSKKAHKLAPVSKALIAIDKRLDSEKQDDKPTLEEMLQVKHAKLKPAAHSSFMRKMQKLAEKFGYLTHFNSYDEAGMEIKARFSFIGRTTLLLPVIRKPKAKAKKKEE